MKDYIQVRDKVNTLKTGLSANVSCDCFENFENCWDSILGGVKFY